MEPHLRYSVLEQEYQGPGLLIYLIVPLKVSV